MTVPKTLVLGDRKLETPAVIPSYRMGDFPGAGLRCLPWKMIHLDAILINAYDFFEPRYRNLLQKENGLRKSLDFQNPIFMDSGGYYFIEKHDVPIDPLEVLEIERRSGVDLGAVLDHPLHPSARNQKARIRETLRNASLMFRASEAWSESRLRLVPVIQGYDVPTIDHTIQCLRRIMREHNGGRLDCVGIGGLAPLSQRRDIRLAHIISHVRKQLPDSHIHCFSMGSPLSMLVAFNYGADTVDSQAWIKNAAFRTVTLPGKGGINLRIRDKTINPAKFNRDYRRLEKEFENLQATESFKPPFPLESLLDTPTENRVHNRALHNLYVFVYEANRVREEARTDSLQRFVRERLAGTSFVKFLDVKTG